MTREQFYDGLPFAVFGIPCDLCYDAANERLYYKQNGHLRQYSTVIEDDDQQGFTALLPAFGTMQVVLIKFSACELKEPVKL